MKHLRIFMVCLLGVILVFTTCVGTGRLNGSVPEGPIKNIILMIGDGMGTVHEDAGRTAKSGPLEWDNFNYRYSMTTYSADNPVTESAAAATAMATGVKTNNGWLAIAPGSSSAEPLDTIMDKARSMGKLSGVITSDLLYGATPAAFSSFETSRSNTNSVVERQIIKGVDLLMGGHSGNAYTDRKSNFERAGYGFAASLASAKNMRQNKIIALFSDVTPFGAGTSETLQDMTVFALDWLSRKGLGFVLMIEGAKIDHRSHDNNFSAMITELLAFDECVKIVKDWAALRDDTVIIVTADHETGGLTSNNDGTYIFTTNGHTAANVNFNIAHRFSEDLPFEWTLLNGGTIDNTDVFNIMRDLLDLKLHSQPVPPQ